MDLSGEPKPKKKTGGRPRHGIVALSSAAVLAVYTAGYAGTSGAARRFDEQDAARALAAPMVALAANPVAPAEHAPAAVAMRPPTSPVAAPEAVPDAPAVIPAMPDRPVAAAEVPAPDPAIAAVAVPEVIAEPAAPEQFKDGTYSGWGTSRHGDIQAEVVVAQGRIASARILQCLTRYSCSWIEQLPGQVVSRQSANVDYISGATQSSEAFYYAIVQALTAAK